MAKKTSESTQSPRERVFMVGVELRTIENLLPLDASLTELALLADTAGLEVVGQTTQKLDHPHPKTFIGPGKVEEVRSLMEELQAEVVLFDEEAISPPLA